MNVLITGAAGFIGSHILEDIYINTNWNIIVIDKLSYASKGFDRIRHLMHSNRIRVFCFDLTSDISSYLKKEIGKIDYIFHLAAESHVNNSIKDPEGVIYNNIISTVKLLNLARDLSDLKLFIHFSTDEVYGNAPNNILYKESDRHNSTNPYSASKSACDSICISYENTYKIPLLIVNCSNVFGEKQHCEKFIPIVIKKLLNNEIIDIHTDNNENPGSRYYIHARNVAATLRFLVKNGKIGERYNITGEKEINNLEVAISIATILNKPLRYNFINFPENRPGHDFRYGIDSTKLKNMGWKLPINFEKSFKKSILWTVEHQEWLEE